jgi:hypothetical protein
MNRSSDENEPRSSVGQGQIAIRRGAGPGSVERGDLAHRPPGRGLRLLGLPERRLGLGERRDSVRELLRRLGVELVAAGDEGSAPGLVLDAGALAGEGLGGGVELIDRGACGRKVSDNLGQLGRRSPGGGKPLVTRWGGWGSNPRPDGL